jgi:hypothetical protein
MTLTTLLNEMARADLKGAEDALKNKDWEKVAKIYVKNMTDNGKDTSSIVRSLGSTFRAKSEDGMIHISKDIVLSKEESDELKAAVKAAAGFKPAERKAAPKKKKEGSEEGSAKAKKAVKKEKEEEPISKPKMFEGSQGRFYSKSIKEDILNMKNFLLKK